MSTLWKRILSTNTFKLFADTPGAAPKTSTGGTLEFAGPKPPGHMGRVLKIKTGTRLMSSLGFNGGKLMQYQIFTPGNAAITVGVTAAAGLTILAATTLAAGATTLVSVMTAQPDVPRSLRFVANQASVGDGTFVTAPKIVLVTGVNSFNEVIQESVALNATTPVETIQCFQSVTSILFPSRNAAGDTVTVTGGAKLGLERPVVAAADLIEIARKATGATSYTVETLPATVDIGEAYVRSTSNLAAMDAATLAAAGGVSSQTVTYDNTKVTGTFPAAPFLVEGITQAGAVGLWTVTNVAVNGNVTTLTIIRGLHGATRLGNHNAGIWLNWRSSYSISPAITANDRLLLRYRSAVE